MSHCWSLGILSKNTHDVVSMYTKHDNSKQICSHGELKIAEFRVENTKLTINANFQWGRCNYVHVNIK